MVFAEIFVSQMDLTTWMQFEAVLFGAVCLLNLALLTALFMLQTVAWAAGFRPNLYQLLLPAAALLLLVEAMLLLSANDARAPLEAALTGWAVFVVGNAALTWLYRLLLQRMNSALSSR